MVWYKKKTCIHLYNCVCFIFGYVRHDYEQVTMSIVIRLSTSIIIGMSSNTSKKLSWSAVFYRNVQLQTNWILVEKTMTRKNIHGRYISSSSWSNNTAVFINLFILQLSNSNQMFIYANKSFNYHSLISITNLIHAIILVKLYDKINSL